MPLRWALPVALAGGLALAAAFPPVGAWPLAVAGPALLAVALWRRSLGASLVVGLVFGAAFFVPLISWLVNVAWYVWAALAVAEMAGFAVLTVGQRLLLRLRAWPVAVAGWWVAAEAVRDRWPYAFPWGRLAMSQAGAPPALVFAAAAGLAVAGRLLPVDQGVPGGPAATVAATQGDVPHARNLPNLWRAAAVTQYQTEATQDLAAQVRAGSRPAPDVVIWPENSADLDPSLNPAIYATIQSAVDAVGRPVLVGAVLENPRRNTGQLWLPRRGPVAVYVKRQLVPFGEYIPFRGLLSYITSLTALQPVNYTPGHQPVVFRIGKIRLGDVICYEVGFDALVRSEVTAGANLLAVQSNDADFELDGQLGETEQQVAMARIRAIESDRAVVYASTTGQSAIISPDGSLIARSGTWHRAELDARVPLRTHLDPRRPAWRLARGRDQRGDGGRAGLGAGKRGPGPQALATRPPAASQLTCPQPAGRRVRADRRDHVHQGAVPVRAGLASEARDERPRPVTDQVQKRRTYVPARADLNDLRVLLTARQGQIPLGLQLVLRRSPPRVQVVSAESAAQLNGPCPRGGQASFQIFMNAVIPASATTRGTA
jgi:apolipoprotein N-acyltransferase